jgi:hypothetical protein
MAYFSVEKKFSSLKSQSVCLAALLFIGCSFLYLFFLLEKTDAGQILKNIPAEEKYFLEAFFRHLISIDNGDHVLFGNKPAALMVCDDWKEVDCHSLLDTGSITDFSPEKKGLEIWKKYQHLFDTKTYAIVQTPAFFANHTMAIFLIHKERLLEILKQNFTEFKEAFPHVNSVKHLLDSLLQDQSMLQQVCQRDDLLTQLVPYPPLGVSRDR